MSAALEYGTVTNPLHEKSLVKVTPTTPTQYYTQIKSRVHWVVRSADGALLNVHVQGVA